MRHLRTFGLAIAATTVLAACGGGDGGGTAATAPTVALQPGSDVPDSASTSVTGVVAFIMSLIASTSDTAEPLTIGNASLATSETAEPEPVTP